MKIFALATVVAASAVLTSAQVSYKPIPTGGVVVSKNSTSVVPNGVAGGSTGTVKPAGPQNTGSPNFQTVRNDGAVANSAGSLAAIGLIAAVFI